MRLKALFVLFLLLLSDAALSQEPPGSRFDFQLPVPVRTQAEAYERVNLAFSHDLPHDLSLYVRVDNLLNSQHQEFIGFPNLGRYTRVGIAYRFWKKKESSEK